MSASDGRPVVVVVAEAAPMRGGIATFAETITASRGLNDRFEIPIANQPGGPEHQRLIRRLRPFLLRRTKREVAKELPDKIIQTVYCELNDEQSTIYKEIVKGAQGLLS